MVLVLLSTRSISIQIQHPNMILVSAIRVFNSGIAPIRAFWQERGKVKFKL